MVEKLNLRKQGECEPIEDGERHTRDTVVSPETLFKMMGLNIKLEKIS